MLTYSALLEGRRHKSNMLVRECLCESVCYMLLAGLNWELPGVCVCVRRHHNSRTVVSAGERGTQYDFV